MSSPAADPPAFAAVADLGQEARARLLALNNAHARETSFLTPGAFEGLVATAFSARATADATAFLIAMAPDAAYDSPNFLWFRARYARFAYVDRVVVAEDARGRGLARALYADLAARARAAGLGRIVCEVNREPPNPGSDAFHAALGFEPVGEARPGPARAVRYLARTLD